MYFFCLYIYIIYNPNTWFSGIILYFFLMIVLMGTAFMSYVLPNGQMSLWGVAKVWASYGTLDIRWQGCCLWGAQCNKSQEATGIERVAQRAGLLQCSGPSKKAFKPEFGCEKYSENTPAA